MELWECLPIITSMYDLCYCDDGITTGIVLSSRMKQGYNLSPTLSNIYQNDLHEIFDDSCDPVELNGPNINSLSWADDLVLFYKSPIDLQNCLNIIQIY